MNLDDASPSDTPIHGLKFNQDASCFSCGIGNTFAVYHPDPLRTVEKQDVGGSVKMVEMLYKCNCLALVGGGIKPMFPDNYLIIWDDAAKGVSAQIDLGEPILSVRLRRDRIVAVLHDSVVIYTFTRPPSRLHSLKTAPNPHGLCCIGSDSDASTLVLPSSSQVGVIEVHNVYVNDQPPIHIPAHHNQLARLECTCDGNLIATASTKGTLIRVFCSKSGAQLIEFRRGSSPANIYCLSFSHNNSLLACVSSRGTAHVFSLGDHAKAFPPLIDENIHINDNSSHHDSHNNHNNDNNVVKKRSISIIPSKAVSSFVRIQLPNSRFYATGSLTVYAVCAFSAADDALIVASLDGSYCKFRFDENGNCNRDEYAKFDTSL